jgi:hypothetical protein
VCLAGLFKITGTGDRFRFDGGGLVSAIYRDLCVWPTSLANNCNGTEVSFTTKPPGVRGAKPDLEAQNTIQCHLRAL